MKEGMICVHLPGVVEMVEGYATDTIHLGGGGRLGVDMAAAATGTMAYEGDGAQAGHMSVHGERLPH